MTIPRVRRRNLTIFVVTTLIIVLILTLKYKFLMIITKHIPKADIPQACKIPELDPFPESFKEFIKPPKDPECSKTTPLYFKSTVNSELIPVANLKIFYTHKIQSCCYRTITRANKDLGYKFSQLCYPVSLEKPTKVNPSHEFIAIFCMNYKRANVARVIPLNNSQMKLVDLHSFIPLKPDVEKRVRGTTQSEDRPNVIIFGFDGVSRANFLRWLPKTHKYLVEELGGIEMQGFNKVGDNTLPNIIPLLTSNSYSHLSLTCAANHTKYLDDCPFIWKDFARKGYTTAFDEDSSWTTFLYNMKGFITQPTDYYLRPFLLVSDDYFHEQRKGLTPCSGPRLLFEEMLSHMTKFIHKMNEMNRPFFYLSMEATITHDDINDAALTEGPMLKTLQWLQDNNHLKNTILIVLSDHGMRAGPMRNSPQGQMEDRLPVMYLVFPQWFKKKYPRAIENLKENKKRLTTILDLNYVLHDILNLDRIRDDAIQEREYELEFEFQKKSVKGISLFLPVPPERTCEHSMISPEFCICTIYEPVNTGTGEVWEAASLVLKQLNRDLLKHWQCAQLELDDIILAQKPKNAGMVNETRYLINFQTKPGGAQFEVLVTNEGRKSSSTRWKLIGSILRTNIYGSQGWCANDPNWRRYCYCR